MNSDWCMSICSVHGNECKFDHFTVLSFKPHSIHIGFSIEKERERERDRDAESYGVNRKERNYEE